MAHSDATVEANALYEEAEGFFEEGALDQAIESYDAIIQRFGKSSDPAVREHVAYALLNKGVALHLGGRRTEAVAAWGALLAHFPAGESTRIDEYREVAAVRGRKLTLPGANAGSSNL